MADHSEKSFTKNVIRYEVILEFEKMRQKQRQLYSQLMEAELELKEFGEVTKILCACNPNRKCFRLMLDQLIESNIENVLPLFLQEKGKLESEIEKLNLEIRIQDEEIIEFQKANNIRMNENFKKHMKLAKGF